MEEDIICVSEHLISEHPENIITPDFVKGYSEVIGEKLTGINPKTLENYYFGKAPLGGKLADYGNKFKTVVDSSAQTLKTEYEGIQSTKVDGNALHTVNTEYHHMYDVNKVEQGFVDSVNSEIEQAVENIRSGNVEKVPDNIEVTKLTDKTKSDLGGIAGFDISDYSCKIEKDTLFHIEDRHGMNGKHDSSLSDPQDVARMGYIINNYDNVVRAKDENGKDVYSRKYNDKNNRPSPVLMMTKKIDGTYCVSFVVPDSKKKTLWITSARIQKADVGSQVPNGNTPQLTPEAPLVSSSANNNIPQPEVDVKNQYMKNDIPTYDEYKAEIEKRFPGIDEKYIQERYKGYYSESNVKSPDIDSEATDIRVEVTGKIPADLEKTVKAVKLRSGIDIVFGNRYVDGKLDTKFRGLFDGKKIIVSENATKADIFNAVVLHELTHGIEGTKKYKGIYDYVLKEMYGNDTARLDADVKAKIAEYKKNGIELTPEKAKGEIVAENVGKYIFADDVGSIVTKNYTLGQKILDVINELIYNIKKKFGNTFELDELAAAQRKYRMALDEVKRNGVKTADGKYSIDTKVDFLMTEDEIKTIQGIGRKSINEFSSEEINKTQTLAKKLYNEMGVKSPFFRAYFGDWRAYDNTVLEIPHINETNQKNPRGKFVNKDTGLTINSSSVGYDETISHSGKDKLSVIAMQNIDKIIENSVLFDTEVSEYGRGKKSVYTCFMHKFYAPVYIDEKPCIAKMAVDESYQPGAKDTNKKFYHVRSIKIEPASSVGIGFNHTPIMDKSGSTIRVSDLFDFVKKYDSEFKPKESSLVLNEDGTPKVMYHGTDAKFNVFDMSKGRANMDIQGSFFSPWELDAQGYGGNVRAFYLSIKNPADGPTAYAALNKFKGQNNAGVKAKEYLIEQGYDGVNFYDEEYVAFYPSQIKSATDNIGTFDGSNPDVRYSFASQNDIDSAVADFEVHYGEMYRGLIDRYKTIKPGEIPQVEDVKVPKKTGKREYVSNFARTMAETKVFSDAMQGEFEQMVVDGNFSHERISNKSAERSATSRIEQLGFENAVNEFETLVHAGRLNKDDIAMGQILLNVACQNKDVELAKKLAVDLSVAATQFGQNVQAFSMLKRMSPDGQLYYLEKTTKTL